MSLVEGLLIAIVIILLTMWVLRGSGGDDSTWDCVNRNTGDQSTVRIRYNHGAGCGCGACKNPEGGSQKENSEYFATCQSTTDNQPAVDDCACGSGPFDYANNEFGAPGLSFTDWVTGQSVDSQTVNNHAEFVKDRLEKNAIWTGRTYSPDDASDGFYYTSWQGIRGKPQRVPVCNPTQVQDTDESWFPVKMQLQYGDGRTY